MRNVYFLLCALLIIILCNVNIQAQGTCADGAYQWSDIATIFQNNGCNVAACHGGAASGLNLTTFAGFNTGGTKCTTEIASGTTLVDIIQTGGVVCANGTVSSAMSTFTPAPVPQADIDAIQAWVDAGAFENCRGVPEDDALCTPASTIGTLDAAGQTIFCSDGSMLPVLNVPTASLPDTEIAVEVNGVLVTVSPDGSFDTTILNLGDEVCYTAFTFDLTAINNLLTTANSLCPGLDFLFPDLLPCAPIGDLVAGVNDGVPGLNGLLEVLDFAASLSAPITSVQSAVSVINNLNATITPLNLGPICYATSNNVCLIVEECVNTCPTVILNDNNLPSLPPAVCADDLLSLCFDVNVDEATFDPSLIQFNYILTLAGTPSTAVLNTSYVSGGGIDPNATGQLCFETNVPVGDDPCAPYELSLEIIDVFYLDMDCPNNFVAFDLNITTPLPLMQTGPNLNDLIPLLTVAGLNPILVQIFPNPNWSANVVQLPACDGATLGTIDILAADGATVCETLTDVGTAGIDGCPPTDAILPETLYENYTTYTDADGVEQPNPCAVSITLAEQVIACENQCIMCPAVVNVIPPNNICPDVGTVTFCVEFDMMVDATTVLTVEGNSVDGAAGGTQICVDVPFTAPIDPCNGAAIDYSATAICDGTDLLDGIVWLSSQILPITDPLCGGVAGCTDNTACNYNPNAVCDDPNDPCLPAPTCNTDPCVGDVEVIDPNDACSCIIDIPQVFGCTDATACNFDAAANCDDNSCDFGDANCANPCSPVAGCTDAAACNFDANACIDDGSCQVPPCNPGCTDPCADNFDPNADEDDGTCNPYDDTCNADCTAGPFGGVWDTTTCTCINEITPDNGCTDATACNFDAAANCDDNSCDFGDANCANPCSPVAGCTDATACNFDANACIDDGSCQAPPCNPGCTDPCADNFDPNADEDDGTCNPYDDTCNADCTAGPFGGVWDTTTCACINEINPISGCTDPDANNYDPSANCDDGSCDFVCEEEINGAIIVSDPTCNVGGIDITIMAFDGTSITVTTATDGTFSVSGGPFTCGDYTAAFTDVSSLPVCYSTTGSIDPIVFTVDGEGGGDDGPFFFSNPEVPTLSQWGLISLALLLMIFGALRLSPALINVQSILKK